jgi:hypothetical protein
MAGLLFQVLLAVLTLAAAAAGFVIGAFAVYLWATAAVLAIATVVAWRWERRSHHATRPPAGTPSTHSDHSPAFTVSGNENTFNVGAIASVSGPAAAALDHVLDLRLGEGDALRDRLLTMQVNAFTVTDLLHKIQEWQRLCIQTVTEKAADRVAVFKAAAGGIQPPMADTLLSARKGEDWRREVESRLERWLAALRHLHS